MGWCWNAQRTIRTVLQAVAAATMVTIQATPTAAQSSDPPREEWTSVTDALRGHEWADAINNLLDVARAMPDSRFDFQPDELPASFQDIVGHIADVQFAFCDRIAGRTGADRSPAGDAGSKAQVLDALMTSIAACDEIFDTLTDEQLVRDRARLADNLTTMMGHTRRETGKLVTYLRLAGVTPPEPRYYEGRTWRH